MITNLPKTYNPEIPGIVVTCQQCDVSVPLRMTPEQYAELRLPGFGRRCVQFILTHLTDGERELLLSGYCNTCFETLFCPSEEEEGEEKES